MYNRYIRNDQGGYSRVPVDEDPLRQSRPGPAAGGPPPPSGQPQQPHADAFNFHQEESAPPPPPPHWDEGDERNGGISGFIRRILDKFHLDSVDTGDVLLLLILFFLFKEDADDELLIALGLLLIL